MSASPATPIRLPKNMLVAVDASPMSDHAITAGVELAHELDARVEFVHAFGSSLASWSLVSSARKAAAGTDELSRARECVLSHIADVLGPKHAGRTRAEDLLLVSPGRPSNVLLERAREVSADMLLLGALQGHRGIDVGSTARVVLAKAECPIWVQPVPKKPIRKILVPIDMSSESMRALGTARLLAQRFRASIQVMHVFQIPNVVTVPWDGYPMMMDLDSLRKGSLEAFEKTVREFDWQGVEHESAFLEGTPDVEILDRSKKADLIVIGTHGLGAVASLLIGSVAFRVLKGATCAVMAVRDPDRKFAK